MANTQRAGLGGSGLGCIQAGLRKSAIFSLLLLLALVGRVHSQETNNPDNAQEDGLGGLVVNFLNNVVNDTTNTVGDAFNQLTGGAGGFLGDPVGTLRNQTQGTLLGDAFNTLAGGGGGALNGTGAGAGGLGGALGAINNTLAGAFRNNTNGTLGGGAGGVLGGGGAGGSGETGNEISFNEASPEPEPELDNQRPVSPKFRPANEGRPEYRPQPNPAYGSRHGSHYGQPQGPRPGPPRPVPNQPRQPNC